MLNLAKLSFFETPCMISFNVFEYDKTQLSDISPSSAHHRDQFVISSNIKSCNISDFNFNPFSANHNRAQVSSNIITPCIGVGHCRLWNIIKDRLFWNSYLKGGVKKLVTFRNISYTGGHPPPLGTFRIPNVTFGQVLRVKTMATKISHKV